MGGFEVKRRCHDGRIIVSPSDQNISGTEAFGEDVLRGLNYVGDNDVLLTMGAKPSRPETSYGYIQMSSPVNGTPDIYKVQSFTEKAC